MNLEFHHGPPDPAKPEWRRHRRPARRAATGSDLEIGDRSVGKAEFAPVEPIVELLAILVVSLDADRMDLSGLVCGASET